MLDKAKVAEKVGKMHKLNSIYAGAKPAHILLRMLYSPNAKSNSKLSKKEKKNNMINDTSVVIVNIGNISQK